MSGPRIAVVGAGLAGATCARQLADAGAEVQVFDKSRGVGGRLATRRIALAEADGSLRTAGFDHGAPAFTAQAAPFVQAVEAAERAGQRALAATLAAPRSYAPLAPAALWVATPDMPAWCRALLADLTLHTTCQVDALARTPAGWQLHSAGRPVAEGLDAVVLALPLPQAAALLEPHQPDWARRAADTEMLPGWVLMGTTGTPDAGPRPWDLAWPSAGPLACIVRNDAKPGRLASAGRVPWVLHATAAWSRTHLASPAAEVQAALQQALADWLGRPLAWHHAVVHRWRFASAPRGAAVVGRCWWDGRLGLGVCGDALGGAGVEGAWLSGHALASAMVTGATA